jgi:hypothetical protein
MIIDGLSSVTHLELHRVTVSAGSAHESPRQDDQADERLKTVGSSVAMFARSPP